MTSECFCLIFFEIGNVPGISGILKSSLVLDLQWLNVSLDYHTEDFWEHWSQITNDGSLT